MNKICIIIEREYISRVKKKSFIVMTFLVPILFAALLIGVVLLMLKGRETYRVIVVDESTLFEGKMKSTADIKFTYAGDTISEVKKHFYSIPFDVILYIPYNPVHETDFLKIKAAQIYFKEQPGIILRETIRRQMEDILYDALLENDGIDQEKVRAARKAAQINLGMMDLDEKGNEKVSESGVLYFFGFVSGVLIYFFILLYGIQVMRGVIEEKANRIVEIIISSVKPFQLMMGKIIGIAMVGLTQFLLWVILSFVLITIGQQTFLRKYTDELIPVAQGKIPQINNVNNTNFFQANNDSANKEIGQILAALSDTKFIFTLLGCFLFYFLGGYLLYSAMFAAFGAAVDNETDTQQFMMPVTIPLLMAYLISVFIIEHPQSPLAFWFSLIPFTSPIVMMARLPFGVPIWELLASMVLLVGAFILITWLAGKIYRTGILIYGKKVTYKELWKWLKYSG